MISRIIFRRITRNQINFFMPFTVIKIRKPTDISKASPFLSCFILPISRFSCFIIVRNFKGHVSRLISEPNLVIH